MDYYNRLFELFFKNYGTRYEENIDYILKQEFYDWLPNYKELTNEYKLYLRDYMGIDLNSSTLAELDKGYIDTVIGKRATMISQYAYTNLLENSNFTVDKNNKILLIKNDVVSNLDHNVNLVISHNPYSKKTIDNIKKSSLRYDIILGMYGKVYDQDKRKKINRLKLLLEELKNSEIDYNEKDDNYFCVLSKKK